MVRVDLCTVLTKEDGTNDRMEISNVLCVKELSCCLQFDLEDVYDITFQNFPNFENSEFRLLLES